MTCPCGAFPEHRQCMTCLEDFPLGAAPQRPLTVEATMTSKFDGHCSGCNLPWSPGVRIAKMSDGTYRHVGCS